MLQRIQRPIKNLINIRMGVLLTAALLFSLCWYDQLTLGLLVLFPMYWVACKNRWYALAFTMVYYLAGSWEMVPAIQVFYLGHYSFFAILCMWMASAFFLAALWWMLLPHPECRPLYVFCIVIVTLLMTALPPIGAIGWLHPLTAAGVLYPALGLIGIALTLLLMGCLAVLTHGFVNKNRINLIPSIIVSICLAASLISNAIYKIPPRPVDWVAINTQLGNWPQTFMGDYTRQVTLMNLTSQAIEKGAHVIILPENIAGSWRPMTESLWQPILMLARKHGASIIIGAEKWHNGIVQAGFVLIDPKQPSQYINSNQPMPFGEWNPLDHHSPSTNWHSPNDIRINQSLSHISVCYEDLLVWPHLYSLLSGRPAITISIANQWFNRPSSFQKQFNSIATWARLSGTTLMRATNISPGVLA